MAAAVVPAADHRWGRRRLWWILLALSLVLNVCFIGGVLWYRASAPPFQRGPIEERFLEMADRLNLDPQQRTAFDRYFRTFRARFTLMREEVEPLIADAWSEIAKPQADEAQVLHLFDEAAAKRRAFQREVTSATFAFLATLSPEQRAQFVVLARRHLAPWAQRINRGVSSP
jgi:Spy/CpxP family protein refolding chaperone